MIRRGSGLVQWLATGRGGNSFLQGEFHSIWTHFWLWKLGEAGAARIQQVEASDAAKRPMMPIPQQTPTVYSRGLPSREVSTLKCQQCQGRETLA